MPWAIDLDGVVWRGTEVVPGSARALARLQAAGEDVLFVTNNAGLAISSYESRLAALGVEAAGRVVGSATAAGGLLRPGERVLVCGGPGVEEAVAAAGAVVHDGDPREAETVVVGFHPFDYAGVTRAHRAIVSGARFVATNTDVSYPVEDGTVPGNGALVAALAASTGVAPVVAGKPHPPMVDLLRERLGGDGIMVGDRPDTDGLLARRLGWRFGLVLSGVVEDAATVDPTPDLVATDLAALVAVVLG